MLVEEAVRTLPTIDKHFLVFVSLVRMTYMILLLFALLPATARRAPKKTANQSPDED